MISVVVVVAVEWPLIVVYFSNCPEDFKVKLKHCSFRLI
jgi:hypothetical protein